MRNYRCPSYGECLNRTIATGLDGFECDGCGRRHATDDISMLEVARAMALIALVLGYGRIDPEGIDLLAVLAGSRPWADFCLTDDADPWHGGSA